MSNLTSLLNYQETDKKLLKIEKELNATEEKKNYSKARKFMKNAQVTLEAYERKAGSLAEEYNDLEAQFKKATEKLKEFTEIDYSELQNNEEEVAYLKKNAQSLADTIKSMKKSLQALKEQMETMTQEYEKLKKQTIVMQKQYKEFKEKYEELVKGKEAEVGEIKKSLDDIAKDVPADLLERYTNKRKEGVWPVLCSLNGDRCSVCSMDVPKAAISRLSEASVIECENCRRLVYKN